MDNAVSYPYILGEFMYDNRIIDNRSPSPSISFMLYYFRFFFLKKKVSYFTKVFAL